MGDVPVRGTVRDSAVAWAAAKGIGIDEETSALLAAALVALCTSLYYGLVTFLERKVNPGFGWLLGAPKVPTYEQPWIDAGDRAA